MPVRSRRLGAGQVASVDGPWTDDTISYAYDQLGRVTTRMINSVSVTWAFDALGRDPVPALVVGAVSEFIPFGPAIARLCLEAGQQAGAGQGQGRRCFQGAVHHPFQVRQILHGTSAGPRRRAGGSVKRASPRLFCLRPSAG